MDSPWAAETTQFWKEPATMTISPRIIREDFPVRSGTIPAIKGIFCYRDFGRILLVSRPPGCDPDSNLRTLAKLGSRSDNKTETPSSVQTSGAGWYRENRDDLELDSGQGVVQS
jgi:hypothetical protein